MATATAAAGVAQTKRTPRPQDRVARILTTLPDWALMTWLALTSTLLGILLGRNIHGPMVFNDERIHSTLANQIATSRFDGIGAAAQSGYGIVYPLLLAPLYGSFSSSTGAYAATKALNSILLASAVVPAFLLARRVVTRRWAFAVAVVTVIGPQAVFASLVMTENAAYPIVLWALLATVVCLERPSTKNQMVALAAIALSIATRMQAVALLVGFGVAVAVYVGVEGREDLRPRITRFCPAAIALAATAVAAVGLAIERGGASTAGAYSTLLHQGYSPLGAIRWSLGNLADVDLLLGFGLFLILPIAIAGSLRGANATRSSRAVAAALVGLGGVSLVMVGAFSSSTQGEHRDHERYLIYFVPMAITLCFRWLSQGGRASRRALLLSSAAAASLPAALPLERMQTVAFIDSFGVQPWLSPFLPIQHLRLICVGTGVTIGALVVVAASRRFVVLVAFGLATVLSFAAVRAHAEHAGRYHVSRADWIDRAVGGNVKVDALFVPRPCLQLVQRANRDTQLWRAQFFNRSLRLGYFVGSHLPGDLDSERLIVKEGRAVTSTGGRPQPRFLLVQQRVRVVGTVIASDAASRLTLIRPKLPLRIELPPRAFFYGCGTSA